MVASCLRSQASTAFWISGVAVLGIGLVTTTPLLLPITPAIASIPSTARLTCKPGCRADLGDIDITKDNVVIATIPSLNCDESNPIAEAVVKLSDHGANDLHIGFGFVQCSDTEVNAGGCNVFIVPFQEPWGVDIVVSPNGPFRCRVFGSGPSPIEALPPDSVAATLQVWFGRVDVNEMSMSSLALGSPAPNPTGGRFSYSIQLPRPLWVQLAVYDVHGHRVQRLREGMIGAGRHDLAWEALTSVREMPNGVYFLRLESDGSVRTRRFALLR